MVLRLYKKTNNGKHHQPSYAGLPAMVLRLDEKPMIVIIIQMPSYAVPSGIHLCDGD